MGGLVHPMGRSGGSARLRDPAEPGRHLAPERFRVTYRITVSDGRPIEEHARDIAIEQTVETPSDCIPADIAEAGIVGRTESITMRSSAPKQFDVAISYRCDLTGFSIPQFLNVLFGYLDQKRHQDHRAGPAGVADGGFRGSPVRDRGRSVDLGGLWAPACLHGAQARGIDARAARRHGRGLCARGARSDQGRSRYGRSRIPSL